MEHKYKRHKLFSELEGYVSRTALGFIADELQRSRTFGFAKEDYGCLQMTTYGLPYESHINATFTKINALPMKQLFTN